jgi:glycosyltransferase involved in cell wall biosynthesis
LRLLIVSSRYPPGGVWRYTYNLVHSLVKNGVDTYVAVNGHETEQNRILKSDTVVKDSIQDDFCNKWRSIKHGFGDDRYSIYTNIIKKGDKKNSERLLQLVKDLKPDVVHVQHERGLYEIDTSLKHIFRTMLYGSTLREFFKKCPVPIVSTLHSVFPYNESWSYIKERTLRKEDRLSFLPLPLRTRIRRWVMEKKRYDLLHEVIGNSAELINLSRTNYEIVKRGSVIYHGAEPAISPFCDFDINKFREDFGLPTDRKLILAFGYAGDYKGFDLLNNITLPSGWSFVVKQNKPERGGKLPIQLKNGISLHLGYLDEVSLSKLFFACDAIIFPYNVISISGVLFDAIAHYLPFVASDLNFFREFSDMNLGITCNRDALSFSESIQNLSYDYERYRKNVLRFAPRLRWQNIANSHTALYNKLIPA